VPERATVVVRAHPRAAAPMVGPWEGGLLHVRVTAPAAEGRATEAIRRELAGAIGVPPRRVRLVAGERARTKRFEIEGMAPDELASRLATIGTVD
jgi:hypothetical protein